MRSPASPARAASILALALLISLFTACDDGATEALAPPEPPDDALDLREQYVIGVISPPGELGAVQPELDFAVARVNAAGGIGGRAPLVLRRVPFGPGADESPVAIAEAFAVDDEVVAVIGPGISEAALEVAAVLDAAEKPFVTASAGSGELLRAFAGSPYVWRTKISDIGQIELTLRRAHAQGVRRIGLVTRASGTGASFFNWFGFYATNLGFAAEDVIIADFSEEVRIEDALREVLDAQVGQVVLVPNRPMDVERMAAAIDRGRSAEGVLPFEVVLADTGLDLPTLVAQNPTLAGWGGYVTTASDASGFIEGLSAISGVPSDAAAGHDAVLLVAYGLEAASGAVGSALAAGMQRAIAGAGAAHPATAEGIAATLEAIRDGEAPDVQGVTGTLDFDPEDGVDVISSNIGRWRATVGPDEQPRFTIEEVIDLGEVGALELRRQRPIFNAPPSGGEERMTPMSPATRMVALIVAASNTWENYRHQADALRQYHRLREMGVPDDDIVMVGADDLVDNPENLLPGIIRNVPGGEDVYRDVVYDYERLSPAQILAVLAGEGTEETPIVVPRDPDATLFVFIVGHGGLAGLVVDANSTEAGLSAASISDVLEPIAFTETLCVMRAAGHLRQALIVVETCYAGVFGEAAFGGVEAGCSDGETRLDDVLVLTAANERENSLAAGYDRALSTWVGDEFAAAFAARVEQAELGTMLSVYQDIYQTVAGSHVGLYNSALSVDLGLLPADALMTVDLGDPPAMP